jgi:7,8-dihydropterin-6-yl-methyl-4-(beta-D-ribofuranosyl)aminobenzene 5'-phosphate synthase
MELTILVDNNTISGSCYGGESGLSCYLQCDGKKILLDTGRTDMFMKNAKRLGIDLLDVDSLVISHGHYDHTWGLQPLVQEYIEASYEKRPWKKAKLITHPDSFLPKEAGGKNIGMILGEAQLRQTFDIKKTKEPVWLTNHLVFLGEIERANDFEAKEPLGHTLRNGNWEDDYLLDDSGIAYMSDKGLVVITACAHAGVCNTVEYAKKVCKENRIHAVIGGFHLLRDKPDVFDATAAYLKDCAPEFVYPCHCVSLNGKLWLAHSLPVKEIGVGKKLVFM